MSEINDELKREQAEWKVSNPALEKVKVESELIAQSSLTEWCKVNGLENSTEFAVNASMTASEKAKIYLQAFLQGQRKLITELPSREGSETKLVDQLDLPKIKSELDQLRAKPDSAALEKKEIQIAGIFQQAISEYPYNMETSQIAGILKKRQMNCVGASVLGGALLNEVGIKYLVGHIGSHVLLLVATSEGKIFWQDMQDGLEKPQLENEELTAEKISGATPSEIASLANNPRASALSFSVNKEYWKNSPMTVSTPETGLELQELISTGFILGNAGKNDEAIEILEIAKSISAKDTDVHEGLARAYANKKMYTKALEAYAQALEIEPESSYFAEQIEVIKNLANAAK